MEIRENDCGIYGKPDDTTLGTGSLDDPADIVDTPVVEETSVLSCQPVKGTCNTLGVDVPVEAVQVAQRSVDSAIY